MPNALARENNPYLRQHADNPVDWLPWGSEALDKAKREDKPIFLSVGYSTCHWCHVMAHESFENEEIARILNEHFVCIKVDREERPDLDRVYMLFVQASTGSGGWPMSVFLTPSLKPFFGGTYFPPDNRYGRPGFASVLLTLARAWKNERDRIEASTVEVMDQLRSYAGASSVSQPADDALFEAAFWTFRRNFDSKLGGFGGSPKFPRPSVFHYLHRYYARTKNEEALDMSTFTLKAMAAGGMHDQLGGGFHRYSVDARWFVPHFEKMLYDQAQLAVAYLEAYSFTQDEEFADTARRIFEYVERDLTSPDGAFYSAEDADSPDPDHPGHSREGAFYVWTKAEIESALGADATEFCRRYGVLPNGNVDEDPHAEFTGRNILYRAEKLSRPLTESSRKLLAVRAQRPRPHRDEKILTAWNALMVSAYVAGYNVLSTPEYLAAAEHAANFLIERMYGGGSGRLLRRLCGGESGVDGFLDDYAVFAAALLDLFEVTGTARYLKLAITLANTILRDFEDHDHGGFFSTKADDPDIVLRLKDDHDGAEPSGNSVAVDVLLRLAHITGDERFRNAADRAISAFAPRLKMQPVAAPFLMAAVGRYLTPSEQIVIRAVERSEEVQHLMRNYRRKSWPYSVILPVLDDVQKDLPTSLAGLERKGRITVYECRNFTCDLPKVFD